MRSTAHFEGHPIHPMLIPFPFAFLFGSLGFDLLGRWTGRADWARTGRSLQTAGLVSALVAAAPGLLDYLYTVPPASSGKRRATQHLISNLSAVTLFAAARASRAEDDRPTTASLVLGAVGAGLMSIGGWLGGTLVYRNEIGVDVRQAGAGKWRETTARLEPGQPVLAASSSELGEDQMKLIRLEDGRRIVLARLDTGYVAFDDHCPHRGGSLAGGTLVNGIVQCAWHGSQFDVRTGKVVQGPAEESIRTYAVEEVDGEVRVRV